MSLLPNVCKKFNLNKTISIRRRINEKIMKKRILGKCCGKLKSLPALDGAGRANIGKLPDS
jgi:hypothetical protein